MKITAVIPVRKGSRRLPDKNILPFGNSNLLINKIRQLKCISKIDNIIVSTDSEEMIEMAIKEGVNYQKRPDEYCDEKSKTFNEVVEYVAKSIDTNILIWAPCVCPLVTINSFNKAIDSFLNLNSKYDSVVSAMLFKEYLFDESKPINFSIENHVPSQKLPDWHLITNGFYIAKAEDMVNWKFVYGKNPKLIEISKLEAIDIDDKSDFEFAEFVYKKQMKTLTNARGGARCNLINLSFNNTNIMRAA